MISKKKVLYIGGALALVLFLGIAISGALYYGTIQGLAKEGVVEWAEKTRPGPLRVSHINLARFFESRFEMVRRDEYKDVEVKVVKHTFAEWAIGMSVQNTIFIVEGKEQSEKLLSHEYTHALQWRRYGTIGFLTRYFGVMPWLMISGKHPYREHPLENEAN